MEAVEARILVVDDDPLLLVNQADAIDDAGFLATTANGVGQAWGALARGGFDLVVSDHDLGDGKGADLLARMEAAGMRTPVVYISAATNATLDGIRRSPLVRKVLVKPVAPTDIVAAIREVLGGGKRGGADDSPFPKLVGDAERDILLENSFLNP